MTQRPTSTSRSRVPSSAEALPSLHELWEQTRAPWANSAEVDRLLLGLSQPLGPEEGARERADLLHRLLEDEKLGAARGSDGRRVDGAVAKALMALGHPYALEISPEGLVALRAAEVEDRSFVIYDSDPAEKEAAPEVPLPPVVLTPRQEWGKALSVGLGLIEGLFALSIPPPLSLVALLAVAITTVLPTRLALSPLGMHNRAVHYFCLILTALPSLVWMGYSGFFLMLRGREFSILDIILLFMLAMALAQLALPFCLYGRRPDPEP